ncbi:Fis family transcriptional regulator [Marinomonas sp. 2405UD66-6]|uniref:Fis family transcriptional regulator n=1 Tax=Marinomonas sp. 2405UD66-6 TaxID=3391834 RepID=UPI0039C8E5C7
MKKSDKKIEKALREALTQVCESALGDVSGFVWLTHLVNFNHFPGSLKIICVFEKDEDLISAREAKQDEYFGRLIVDELNRAGLSIKNLGQSILFDTEEACERSHNGKWNERLHRLTVH